MTDNISDMRASCLAALKAASQNPPALIAVSKQQSDGRVADMLATGQMIFGENRVQEAQTRWGETFADKRKGLTLHLIGPLQSNKALDAAKLFDVIQTLDRESLAKSLAKAGDALGQLPELFVQVNTGEEPQKSGVTPQALEAFLKLVRGDYGLNPAGLMCIPPANEAPSPHFILLSKLAQRNGLSKLSMGMSADFEVAAALGASHVRVGSAIFGPR
ncbi:MAG: YggS family pyridoxal phosphate-dependent enzyme [Robiginitomaculum sp.]